MVENGYRHLAERTEPASGEERHRILVRRRATGRPRALLLARHHRRLVPAGLSCLKRRKAACSVRSRGPKTLALVFSSLLSITLVPALMPICLRGKLQARIAKPCGAHHAGHLSCPILRWCLRHWKLVVVLNLAFLAATIPLYFRLGSQFMPALYEGSSLYMPSALPGISVTQAVTLMQQQDRVIKSFPEVATVFGTVGRSDSATDNAPLDMYDTTIMLKPREQWRPGMTYEKLIHDMDEKLQFPGLTNTWTMPVENRLDMELTGIKTAVGIKIQGPDLARIQDIGAQMQQVLSSMPATSAVFAERVSQGFYLNIEVNRPEAARYGLTVGDVQRVINSEIGGANIAENVEGRQRIPIAVRYQRDFRDSPQADRQSAHPDSNRRADSDQPGRARLVLAWSGDDSRRRRRAYRIRVSQPEDQRLWRLRGSGNASARKERRAARWIHLALGWRIRI